MKKDMKNSLDEFISQLQNEILTVEQTIYSKKVIEEYNNPKNVGYLQNPNGKAMITGPCGDTMEIHLKVKDRKIFHASFMTDGCGATIACGSMITSLVKGKHVGEAEKITDKDLINALDGLPKENLHCATLAVNTLQEAIKNYYKNKEERGELNEMRNL